jgi:hypothetical protein
MEESMSTAMATTAPRRSQAWFPGLFVPVRHMTGIEVLPARRVGVHVAKTTIHGNAAELRALARAMMQAADLAEAPTAHS